MSSLCRTISREIQRRGYVPYYNLSGNRRNKRFMRKSKEYRWKEREAKRNDG